MQQHMIVHEIRKIELGPYLEEAAHTLVWKRIGPQLRAIPLLGSFINEGTLAKFEVIAAAAMKDEAGPLERLEAIVNEVAKREFRTIERLGAVLGFLIGCLQLVILLLSGAITL